MNKFLHKIEIAVYKSIPFCLVALLFIIIAEVFYSLQVQPYRLYLDITYYIVTALFILDLIFKYARLRDVKKFFRLYWIEILAIFPFYLIFRSVEALFALVALSDTVSEGQKMAHEVAAASKILREAEIMEAAKAARLTGFARFARIFSYSLRLLKAKVVLFKHHGNPHSRQQK